MGTQLIGNPGGDNSESPGDIGQTYVQVINGDTVTLTSGTLVEAITPFTSSSTTFTVKRSATSVDNMLIGVVAGASIPVGGAGRVTTEGIVSATFDGATTAGHVAIQSTSTAGDCHDTASVVAGQTIGMVLQTIGSAGAAFVYVHKV